MDSSIINAILNIAKSLDWSPWITSIATLVLAILTVVYVRLTKRILDAQSDPCVIVSVIPDDERSTVLQLVVRNIGTNLAHDIFFEFSRPIPAHAWGILKDEAKKAEEMTYGPLIDGIPALGPGEQRKIDWGQYGGLLKNLGSDPVTVTCRFKKNGKTMPPVECKLDVKSYEGTIAAEVTVDVERPIAKVASELEKISKDLHHLATGFHKLKVEMYEK